MRHHLLRATYWLVIVIASPCLPGQVELLVFVTVMHGHVLAIVVAAIDVIFDFHDLRRQNLVHVLIDFILERQDHAV